MAFISLALHQSSHSVRFPPSCSIPFPPLLPPSQHFWVEVSVLDFAVFIPLSLFHQYYFLSVSPCFPYPYLFFSALLRATPIRLLFLPVAVTLASCSSVRPVLRDETKEQTLAFFIQICLPLFLISSLPPPTCFPCISHPASHPLPLFSLSFLCFFVCSFFLLEPTCICACILCLAFSHNHKERVTILQRHNISVMGFHAKSSQRYVQISEQ